MEFIKDTEKAKIGEVAMASKKSAEAAVNAGVAEYVNEENKVVTKNKKEKRIYKSGVTDVESVTNVTNVTNVTEDSKNTSVTSVTCYKHFSNTIFSEKTIDLILKEFVDKKDSFTFDELAKNLSKKEGTIRQVINRNKQYFDVKYINGKKCNTFLSQTAIDEIKSRIDNLNRITEQKLRIEEQKKEAESYIKSIELNIDTYLRTTNLKRNGNIITLDFNTLSEFDPKLADKLLDEPQEFLNVLNKIYNNEMYIEILNIPKISVLNIEDIRVNNLNKLIVVEGRVTSLGSVKPLTKKIKYECKYCGNELEIEQNYRVATIKEPYMCKLCGKRDFFVRDINKVDSCFLQLEDLQDNTDNPQSRRIKSVLFEKMCKQDKIKTFTPGNEVRCIGILKEVPLNKGNKKSLFEDLIFEIIGVELIEEEVQLQNLSEEELSNINNLSLEINNNGLDVLTNEFAPDIYGYEQIKKAIILQLCNKRNDKKNKNARNKSNILLIGDPGVAKSVLCNFAISITPGSRKAVGGGSSAVGITASVIKEEDSLGGYRVEPGAMVLAKELFFLDEMNNLSEEDKPKLQEGMNEQTISINKANLHVQMKVTGGTLATANPKYGKFKENSSESLQEQFNIPTPILNRFDSIFVFRDSVNLNNDKKIAEKMIKRHRNCLDFKYNKEFLRKFFTYIRNFSEPEINDEIQEYLKEIYSELRFENSINPRFLESLTRMIIASAKLRQSKFVERKDIDWCLEILSHSQYGIKVNKK